MDTLPELNFTKLINGLYRRKGLIVAVFFVVFSLAAYLARSLPDVYQSNTLILINPQKIPSSYISSTVTTSIRERIFTISQQILSRARLEQIIREFDLYPASESRATMVDRVESLRKRIKIDVRQRNTFRLSFESASPEKAMQVTSRLASLFIEENLQVREQQAMGTTNFINAEAERLRKELESQEEEVNQYKVNHRFELPDQVDANLRTLEQLRGEFQNSLTRIASLQERKGMLERQIVEAETMAPEVASVQDTGVQAANPQWREIDSRKRQLETLLIRYSNKHPEVIRLREEIKTLEAVAPPQSPQTSIATSSSSNSLRRMLLKQVADLDAEIHAIQLRTAGLRDRIGLYQSRVDNTPLRAIELSKITRTYNITLKKYQDLLAKSIDSQLSENMEKKQKGEQFQIIDPADFPQKPVRPNRMVILLVGLLAGLGGGLGLALLWENLDPSFKDSDEINGNFDIPVLGTVPAVVTQSSVLEQRRSVGILVLAAFGFLVAGMIFIRLFGQTFF